MKAIVNLFGKEIEIYSLSVKPAGYGHKKITVELFYNGDYKAFSAVTNNMPATDEANELEGIERYISYFSIIEDKIADEIGEWLEGLA